jgi:hypothetical protein
MHPQVLLRILLVSSYLITAKKTRLILSWLKLGVLLEAHSWSFRFFTSPDNVLRQSAAAMGSMSQFGKLLCERCGRNFFHEPNWCEHEGDVFLDSGLPYLVCCKCESHVFYSCIDLFFQKKFAAAGENINVIVRHIAECFCPSWSVYRKLIQGEMLLLILAGKQYGNQTIFYPLVGTRVLDVRRDGGILAFIY